MNADGRTSLSAFPPDFTFALICVHLRPLGFGLRKTLVEPNPIFHCAMIEDSLALATNSATVQ